MVTDSDSGDWQIPVSYYWKNSLRPDSVTLAPHERPLHTKTRDEESFPNSPSLHLLLYTYLCWH